jgi:hypothetical protein
MSDFKKLEAWFVTQCNGEWEHSTAIKITTLDNPGWALDVRLQGTTIENQSLLETVEIDRNDEDWLRCWTENGKFKARGGPHNLNEMIDFFVNWANHSAPKKLAMHDNVHPQSDTTNFTTWISFKRVDTQYIEPHKHFNKFIQADVPTPHVHERAAPGGVRPATPGELPQ